MTDHPPAPRLEPELALALAPPIAPAHPVAPPTVHEQVHTHIAGTVKDALHELDLKAYLTVLARTDPKTFRQWVEMALPRTQRQGAQQANIINVTNALPKSPLDALPPGFDAHI